MIRQISEKTQKRGLKLGAFWRKSVLCSILSAIIPKFPLLQTVLENLLSLQRYACFSGNRCTLFFHVMLVF